MLLKSVADHLLIKLPVCLSVDYRCFLKLPAWKSNRFIYLFLLLVAAFSSALTTVMEKTAPKTTHIHTLVRACVSTNMYMGGCAGGDGANLHNSITSDVDP